MARDVRTNRSSYNIRCKYYKGTYVNKMKLVQSPICEGVFYAKDLGVWETGKTKKNNYQATAVVGRIETRDIVDLKADDYVYYDGNLHLIVSFTEDDSNTNKEYSRRPTIVTQIDLRR